MRFPLFRKRPPVFSLEPGQRAYAIGDVHGRLDLLERLLSAIDRDDAERGAAATHLILLGDLVDRGPDSKGVVERAMDLAATRPRVGLIMGNHEEILVGAVAGDTDLVRLLLRVGGIATLESYGIGEREIAELDAGALSALIRDTIPPSHVDAMAAMLPSIRLGEIMFVHAGIRPRIRIEEQREQDLRWIREPFLSHQGSHGVLIVHGHSVVPEVDARPNRVNIDTGAYRSGVLTAIGLEGTERWFLSTGPTAATP